MRAKQGRKGLSRPFCFYSQLPRRRRHPPRFKSPPCHRPLNAAAVLHYICVSSRFSSRFFTLFDNREKSKKKNTFFPQLTVSHLDVFKNMQWLFIFLVWKNKYISSWDPTPWQTSACLCGVALPEGLDPPNKTPSLSLKLRLVSKTCQSECLLSMVLSVITACCCHYKVNPVQPVLPVKRKEKVLLLTDCIEEAGLSTWQRLPFHVQ